MSGDIEEFLRRAAQRRAKRQSPPDIQILDAEVIEEVEAVQPRVLSGSSVAEHVSEHIQSGVFDEQLSHLGEQVDRSDDRMEAHLHEVFEHKLGQLGARTSVAAESTLDDDSPPPQTAPSQPTDFLSLLREPGSIQQAIILSEILKRPEDRW